MNRTTRLGLVERHRARHKNAARKAHVEALNIVRDALLLLRHALDAETVQGELRVGSRRASRLFAERVLPAWRRWREGLHEDPTVLTPVWRDSRGRAFLPGADPGYAFSSMLLRPDGALVFEATGAHRSRVTAELPAFPPEASQLMSLRKHSKESWLRLVSLVLSELYGQSDQD